MARAIVCLGKLNMLETGTVASDVWSAWDNVPFFLMPNGLGPVEEAVGFAPASPTLADIVCEL